MEKQTRIDAAIQDTKYHLQYAEQQIVLWSRERDVYNKILNSLEAIKENKVFDDKATSQP